MKASDITMHNTLTSMPSASIPVHSLSGSPPNPDWPGQTSVLFYFLIIVTSLFIVYLVYVRFLDAQEVNDE